METIRKAKLTEVTEVKRLLDQGAQDGALLARPLMELYEFARDFFVYADGEGLGGCGALHIDMADLAEVRSLMVRPDLRGRGIGLGLLRACVDDARHLGIPRIYTLTRIPEFFAKRGFVEVAKHALPHKVYNDCVRCPLFPDCDEVPMTYDLNCTEDDTTTENMEGPRQWH